MDKLGKVYIEPTNRCNLDCVMCARRSWDEPVGDMTWDVFDALLESLGEFPEVHTLSLAGCGEPLLHPRVPEMIRLAHARGLRTEMTSNASLLTPVLARELLRAGLDQFVVSIDGGSEEAHGAIRGESLAKVTDNVRLLADGGSLTQGRGPRIGIEFVAMKRNIRDLSSLHVVARRVGASFILVTNVLPYTPELSEQVLYQLSATAVESEESYDTPTWFLPRMDWNRETQAPLSRLFRGRANLRILDARLDREANHCPFIEADSLAVAWHGGVSPCPPLMHSYTCYMKGRAKRFRRYEAGRLPEQALRRIWEGPAYTAFRERVRTFDFPPCVDCSCELAESNETDCRGNPFPVCGDCLWARGVIRCA